MRKAIKIWTHFLALLILSLTIVRGSEGESAQERGATEFREKGCVQCHAIGGVGGQKGPDLSGVGRRKNKIALRLQILNGGGAMPAFREALSDDEVDALVRYLERCRAKSTHQVVAQTKVP